MIQFNEEIKKFKPSLEVDYIEEDMQESNMTDLLDILRHMTAQNVEKSKNSNVDKE